VVEVRVGEQDRVERDAAGLDRLQQARRLLAGIDDDRMVAAPRAQEKAVLLHRADGEHRDVQGHQWVFLRASPTT
jgi:hypothetical protein